MGDPSLPAVAAVLAREEGARVTAVFCLESVGAVALPELDLGTFTIVPGTTDETRQLARDRVADALTRLGLHGDSFVIDGPPAASIVRTAEDFLAELVSAYARPSPTFRRRSSRASCVLSPLHFATLSVAFSDFRPKSRMARALLGASCPTWAPRGASIPGPLVPCSRHPGGTNR